MPFPYQLAVQVTHGIRWRKVAVFASMLDPLLACCTILLLARKFIGTNVRQASEDIVTRSRRRSSHLRYLHPPSAAQRRARVAFRQSWPACRRDRTLDVGHGT